MYIGKEPTDGQVKVAMDEFRNLLAGGKVVAFVIRKGALSCDLKISYKNNNTMIREEIIRHIASVSGEDPVYLMGACQEQIR